MGNKLPCPCCEHSSTPIHSQMKINVVINSEQVSCSCLPSEIEGLGYAARSGAESFAFTEDLNKFENFEIRKGDEGRKGNRQGRNFSLAGVKKGNTGRSSKSVNIKKGEKGKKNEIPCIEIDLSKSRIRRKNEFV